jgi:hypothetical protein
VLAHGLVLTIGATVGIKEYCDAGGTTSLLVVTVSAKVLYADLSASLIVVLVVGRAKLAL